MISDKLLNKYRLAFYLAETIDDVNKIIRQVYDAGIKGGKK